MNNKITDPVTGINYPESWIKKSDIPYGKLNKKISEGKYVLVHDGSLLKRGYTTGTIAASAAKGAKLSEKNKSVNRVKIQTPVKVKQEIKVEAKNGEAISIKPNSDHSFDSTEGVKIKAEIEDKKESNIKYGEGIGKVENTSFSNIRGNSVSESAHTQIKRELNTIDSGRFKKSIKITIPKPPKKALKVNEKLGIKNGISILGSTGFVEPWNEKFIDSKMELAKASDKVVFTTGMMGVKYSNKLFPSYEVVKIGRSFDRLIENDFENKDIVLAGLPGLILRWGNSDILEGKEYSSVKELVDNEPKNEDIDIALKNILDKINNLKIVLFKDNGDIIRKANFRS